MARSREQSSFFSTNIMAEHHGAMVHSVIHKPFPCHSPVSADMFILTQTKVTWGQNPFSNICEYFIFLSWNILCSHVTSYTERELQSTIIIKHNQVDQRSLPENTCWLPSSAKTPTRGWTFTFTSPHSLRLASWGILPHPKSAVPWG